MIQLDIKTLEQLSGIKAHTIRMWEHRFRLFRPSRTAGNRRIYGLSDLKHLLDITILWKHGYTISRLINLAPVMLQQKINQLSTRVAVQETSLNQLMIAYVDADIALFEDTLSTYAAINGIHQCVSELIIPFINRIGLFYYLDQKPATHFVVTALRKKLLHATDSLKEPHAESRSALLFLPPNQHFDLLLLCVSYELQRAGIKVFYLGTNVGADIIATVISKYGPDFLVTYVSPIVKVCSSEKVFLTNVSGLHRNLIITAADIEVTALIFDDAIPYYLAAEHITRKDETCDTI